MVMITDLKKIFKRVSQFNFNLTIEKKVKLVEILLIVIPLISLSNLNGFTIPTGFTWMMSMLVFSSIAYYIFINSKFRKFLTLITNISGFIISLTSSALIGYNIAITNFLSTSKINPTLSIIIGALYYFLAVVLIFLAVKQNDEEPT